MPDDEKDRYGDKLRDVERGREEHYFAQRDRELLQKLKTAPSGDEEETVRELAHMRCPRDGERLVETKHLDVTLDECPKCEGIWLDKGELESINQRESSGWLARYLGRGR